MTSKTELEFHANSMKGMMRSCYAYGGIQQGSNNYKQYILPYRSRLGSELFEKIYAEASEELSGMEVVTCAYTDNEGLTYNSLKPKSNEG